MTVIKVVELVGQSDKSWEDAVQVAVKEAAKTIRHISGVEVLNWTVATCWEIEENRPQVAFRVES